MRVLCRHGHPQPAGERRSHGATCSKTHKAGFQREKKNKNKPYSSLTETDSKCKLTGTYMRNQCSEPRRFFHYTEGAGHHLTPLTLAAGAQQPGCGDETSPCVCVPPAAGLPGRGADGSRPAPGSRSRCAASSRPLPGGGPGAEARLSPRRLTNASAACRLAGPAL